MLVVAAFTLSCQSLGPNISGLSHLQNPLLVITVFSASVSRSEI